MNKWQEKWQERTVELAAKGLRPFEVAKELENEFGCNMYNKVQKFMKKYCQNKENVPQKHIAVQNLEPTDFNTYIQRITPEFIPFYVAEKDDYKKFK